MKRLLIAFLFVVTMAWCNTASAITPLRISILFEKDSVNMVAAQQAQLELMVDYMKKHPAESVIVGGYTSKLTPADKIEKITTLRAEGIKKLLVEKYGISKDRITAIGVGISEKYDEPSFNEVVNFYKP